MHYQYLHQKESGETTTGKSNPLSWALSQKSHRWASHFSKTRLPDEFLVQVSKIQSLFFISIS